MKYKYTLQFLNKKTGEKFMVSEKRDTWLNAEGFARLFNKGIQQGGRYLKSWRT